MAKQPIGRPQCRVCNKLGYTAVICLQFEDLLTKKHTVGVSAILAYFNTENGGGEQSWMLDSGVTHHLTTDANYLMDVVPYLGHDKVRVGNGSNLKIEKISSP